MQLIKQKKNCCLITSLAMVTGDAPELVAARINQDILHIQECQDYVDSWHASNLVHVERCPVIGGRVELRMIRNAERRFKDYLNGSTAILLSKTHAYAWDGKSCYDPRGKIIESLPDDVNEAYLVIKSFSYH